MQSPGRGSTGMFGLGSFRPSMPSMPSMPSSPKGFNVGSLPSGGGSSSRRPVSARSIASMRSSTRYTAEAVSEWTQLRRICFSFLNSNLFEAFICALVLLSFSLVVVEADAQGNAPGWLRVANSVLLCFYTVEVVFKLYVFRLRFFCSVFNCVDFLIVVSDIVLQVMQGVAEDVFLSVAPLRIFRMMKLARGYKVITRFPQLTLMIKGLASAISVACYGVCLLLVALTVWGVCAVQFIHPVNQRVSLTGAYENCYRCEHAFSSVRSSILTFIQQIIAGDSWGEVTIPIIEEAPETALFFAIVFVSIHFTIINVILAVIVDTALKASQDDIQEIIRHKQDEYNSAARRLKHICAAMDQDQSGDLTEEEIYDGYDNSDEFRSLLKSMDVQKEDMHVVFNILDADESGSVSYDEFITELFKMKSHDSHTLLVFIKHYVSEIRRDMQIQVRGVKKDIMNKIDQEARQQAQRSGSMLSGMAAAAVAGVPSGMLVMSPEDKLQQQAPQVPCQAESLKDLGEELRSLRRVISEDLVRSMKELSQKTESHKLLFSSAAAAAHSHGGTSGGRSNRSYENGRPASFEGEQKLRTTSGLEYPSPSFAPSELGRRAPSSPSSQRLPQRLPASAWGKTNCCGIERADASRSRMVTID